MLQYIIRRSAYSLLILLGVLILTFVLFRMSAGDPSATILGKNPRPEEVERVRASLGADKPLFYGRWRTTEAYTNAVFLNERDTFANVDISGPADPGPAGIILQQGTSLEFKRNFVFDSPRACLITIGTDEPMIVNGVELSPDNGGITLELPPENALPETLRITAVNNGTLLKSVHFQKASENPWDSQLTDALKEVVSFSSEFPFVSFFNFGTTLSTKEPIREKLWRCMWPSLFLMLPVFFGELLCGIVLAMIASVWHGKLIDRIILVISVAGMSISYIALIIFGQWLMGYYWNWFPVWGWGSARYLVLPVIIGIISGTGSGVRFYRTVFLNEINREYLRTAVAKGASPVAVYGKHLLKNSMIPIITRASNILPFLFTGSLLLESFFGIPGLGNAGINALHDADLQMLKALVILSSFLFVVINLLADIAYAYADPRIRLKTK